MLGRQYVAVGSTLVNQKPPTIRYRRTGVKNKILYFAVLIFEIKINRQPVCWAESSGSCLSTSVVSSVSSSPPSYFKTLSPGSEIYCNICCYIIKCYSKRDSEKKYCNFPFRRKLFSKTFRNAFFILVESFHYFLSLVQFIFPFNMGEFQPSNGKFRFLRRPSTLTSNLTIIAELSTMWRSVCLCAERTLLELQTETATDDFSFL